MDISLSGSHETVSKESASDILSAALNQMDGYIKGSGSPAQARKPPLPSQSPKLRRHNRGSSSPPKSPQSLRRWQTEPTHHLIGQSTAPMPPMLPPHHPRPQQDIPISPELSSLLQKLHRHVEHRINAIKPAASGEVKSTTSEFQQFPQNHATEPHTNGGPSSNSIDHSKDMDSSRPSSSSEQSGTELDELRSLRMLLTQITNMNSFDRFSRQYPQTEYSRVRPVQLAGGSSTLPTNGITQNSSTSSGSIQHELNRLEYDKQSLSMQVGVLSEQVEAQAEKISELQNSLSERKERTADTEQKLQMFPGRLYLENGAMSDVHSSTTNGYNSQELLSRTALESHKLDLMAEMAGIKLKLATADKERIELQEKLQRAQDQISLLHRQLSEKDYEISELRTRVLQQNIVGDSDDIDFLDPELYRDRQHSLDRLYRKHSDIDRMKKAVASLMESNTNKDKKIQELKNAVKRYRRIEDLILGNAKNRQLTGDLLLEGELSDSSSSRSVEQTRKKYGTLPGLNQSDYDQPVNSSTPDGAHDLSRRPPQGPTGAPGPRAFSSASLPPSARLQRANLSAQASVPVPSVGAQSNLLHNKTSSYEELDASKRSRASPKSPSGLKHKHQLSLGQSEGGDTFDADTGQLRSSSGVLRTRSKTGAYYPSTCAKPPPAQRSKSSVSALSRNIIPRLRLTNKFSTSAPNLVEGEASDDDFDASASPTRMQLEIHPNENQDREKTKKKGKWRFFGRRLRRSNSQEMSEQPLQNGGTADSGSLPPSNFQRGGVRATAMARLAGGAGSGTSRSASSADPPSSDSTTAIPSSADVTPTEMLAPFARWTGPQVAAWLVDIGLEQYRGTAMRWLRSGSQLLHASLHDFEKELGMRHPLHRKKLDLALRHLTSPPSAENITQIDHMAILRWLDDIGLAQYKDAFGEARVDGRVLNYLTVDDLLHMKVTSELHHLSIKRAIQVLRMNAFDMSCLRRRPLANEAKLSRSKSKSLNYLHISLLHEHCPNEVMLWTNHRIMEWLRSIDLSEYAPNLRGSGVHGALLILEPRFTLENLASILCIPSQKTLLRRHMSSNFIALIGAEIQRQKRDAEHSLGYVPLTPNSKVKMKRGIFAQRRSRTDPEADNYVCPLDNEASSILDGSSAPIYATISNDHVLKSGEGLRREVTHPPIAERPLLSTISSKSVEALHTESFTSAFAGNEFFSSPSTDV